MAKRPKAVAKAPAIEPKQLVLVVMLLMIGAGAAFYFSFYADLESEVAVADQRLTEVRRQVAELEDKRHSLLAVQAQADKIQARLELLKDRLPSSQEELDEFLSDINQRQQNARVQQWMRYEPLPPVADGEVDRIPIRMEFLASFDAATSFFWELSQMGADDTAGGREQLVNVTNFQIRREDKGQQDTTGLVRVTCLAETYLYRGEQPEQSSGNKRQRRRR